MCKVTKKKDNIYFHVIISTADMSKRSSVKTQRSNYYAVF